MHLSIRTKVLFTVTLTLLIIFSLTMFLLVTDTTSRLKNSLNEESKSFSSLATTPIGSSFNLYQDSGTIKITQQINNFLALDPDITAIQIISTDGSQVFSSNTSTYDRASANDTSSFTPVYKYSDRGYINESIQPLIDASGVHRYAIVYHISSKRVEQNVRGVIRLIFYLGTIVLLIGIVGTGFLLNRFFIKPLKDVSQSANIISSGQYDREIKSKSHDEIGGLAAAVNKMAESLKADITKLKDLDKLKSEFLMIASHNLRTPITTIRGYLEIADSTESTTELKAILKNINDSVMRLNSLAEDVLTIATLESGGKFKQEPIKIVPFINSIIGEMAPLSKKKLQVWQLNNSIPDDLVMSIDESNIHSALASIIDNAIKFTPEKGSISIITSINNDNLIFEVNDTGIGIPPEELNRLFTKFHRGTSTLTYDYAGEGLGLYLSKLIIDQHHGKIVVASQVDKGTKATISLPVNKVKIDNKKKGEHRTEG